MTSTATQNVQVKVALVGAGSRTLMRGLDVIEAIAQDMMSLTDLADKIGLARSTTHRLASALVERRYLAFTPRAGYRLGLKLLELGFLAQEQANIVQIARPHLEELGARTEDTVHLGVLEGDHAFYLDKVLGQRRINISSRVGDRQPLSSTGLGKALMLDHPETYWSERYAEDRRIGALSIDENTWRDRMHGYVEAGCVFGLEENDDQIHCVAAPLRDAGGRIVGALSVSSAAQYMDAARMNELSAVIADAAAAVSRHLGWTNPPA